MAFSGGDVKIAVRTRFWFKPAVYVGWLIARLDGRLAEPVARFITKHAMSFEVKA